jgi:hypothetical protein
MIYLTQDQLQWLTKALGDELTYQDNHKVLQCQCFLAGEVQVCWTHGKWMSDRQVWPTCIKFG